MTLETEQISIADLKVKAKKATKPKKPKEKKDIRTMFRKAMVTIQDAGGVEHLKKPWMSQKAFQLITNAADLQTWADTVLLDSSRHFAWGGETSPVIAVDTETLGLDTRVLVDFREVVEYATGKKVMMPVYEINIDISGICLSSNGIDGIYIPITHVDGNNIDREDCRRILQRLFDLSHLVFYNAKYDREVLRICMGLEMRPYPHFEDVQVLAYINDPKADLGDKKKGYTGSSGGLKALSKNVLGIEQINLDTLAKVKADYCPLTHSPFCDCTEEQRKEHKHSQKNAHAPFSWIPTDYALWYAAGDAICTWLLWEKMHPLARTRKLVHRIDHELVDSLAWMERQRFLVDTDRVNRTSKWHQAKLRTLEAKLRELALADGFEEVKDEHGTVLEDDQFNPGSNVQLAKLFFQVKGFKPTKITGAGNASCDKEVIEDLQKLYPDDKFLKVLKEYREYVALHPENLRYDHRDNSARIALKQCVVAGGRLSGSGGDFELDGGFGLNPQGIKKVESHKMWKVKGNVLEPDEVAAENIEEHDVHDLHSSCFRPVDVDKIKKKHGPDFTPNSYVFAELAAAKGWIRRDDKWCEIAPGIKKNHIGQYLGYAICLVPSCTTCAHKHGVLIENGIMDANQVINLRCLFRAEEGWTYFCVDYSNIEMRCAANVSLEPEFVNEFIHGSGDFHSLTASKVFPEFTDPKSSAAVRKDFRNLAKIINFALLYGGTAYTIFENMRKKNPNITFEECQRMVEKYWLGVPVFKEFCDFKQAIAKEHMKCTTATGRVINFESAMTTLGIHKPSKDEMKAFWDYRKLKKQGEEAKKRGDKEVAKQLEIRAQRVWKDTENGVRNAQEYNRFLGKIQRVSVNVPLQGLAGDFMRMAMNRIRKWVLSDPDIQSIFRLHASVHDEVDFTVKNEYAPFIMPRITRLMKLRTLHEKKKWPVHIEADAEYGRNWDVDHHLTGDADHKPAAWQYIKGCEGYVPTEFDMELVKKLLAAIRSGNDSRMAKAEAWLTTNLHPRAAEAAWHCFHKDGGKDAEGKKITKAQDDQKAMKQYLLAALQLHEFWTVDNTPDEDESKLETLAQYEARVGLTESDRGAVPEFGYLGAVPIDKVKRPEVPTLNVEGTDVPAEQVEIRVGENAITAEIGVEEPQGTFGFGILTEQQCNEVVQKLSLNHRVTTTELEVMQKPEQEVVVEPATLNQQVEVAKAEITEVLTDTLNARLDAMQSPEQREAMEQAFNATPEQLGEAAVAANVPEPEESVLMDEPVRLKRKVVLTEVVEAPADGIPVLREDLDVQACIRLKIKMGVGSGDRKIEFRCKGRLWEFDNAVTDQIPEEYLAR